MHVNITELKAANLHRWQAMHIRPARLGLMMKRAAVLVAHDAKSRYEKIVEGVVAKTGVKMPWWFVAVVHEREADGPPHFDKHLGQGDPLSHKTIHEPKNRGPFLDHEDDPPGEDAFYRGALDALIDCAPHAGRWTDWSIGGALTLLEEYNGLGYAALHVPSAYVWSGSDQYVSGKYIADHVYRARAVDVQEGCAPLLACMAALDETIKPTIYFQDQPLLPGVVPHPMQAGSTVE